MRLVLDTALETAQWEFAVAMSIADSPRAGASFIAAIRAEAAYQSAKVRAWELYRVRMSELSEAHTVTASRRLDLGGYRNSDVSWACPKCSLPFTNRKHLVSHLGAVHRLGARDPSLEADAPCIIRLTSASGVGKERKISAVY